MSDFYILDQDRNPMPAKDVLEWGRWFEANQLQRIVAQTAVGGGGAHVSTVFLGVDHSFARHFGGEDSRPILFETMIFGGVHDGEQWRYATWKEAEEGHKAAVATATAGLS